MTLERTTTQNVPKPWGRSDLRPWNEHYGESEPIGEVWYQRAGGSSSESALLLKVLFTSQPLSIQVHPNDDFARSIGLPHGKNEAWYVLSAVPNARIALGLKRRMRPGELRTAIESGSIVDSVQWRSIKSGEAILVSAGTIHAIGAGMVLVEIQQRSDATFRMFDYGRQRELHIDHAVASAKAEQPVRQSPLRKLTKERTLLVANPSFVLERIDLPPGSDWELLATGETWVYVLEGRAWIGSLDTGSNEAIFLQADSARIRVRSAELKLLVAYVGADPDPELLRGLEGEAAGIPKSNQEESFFTSREAHAFRLPA